MDDKWFKAQQRKAGKTAEDIAAVLGRDRSVVSKILSGKLRMSVDWAGAFSQALGVPIATILEKAGTIDPQRAAELAPGFSDSDATPFILGPGLAEGHAVRSIAEALGGGRPGIDVWQVKGRAMALAGMLDGDFFLLDTHQAERVRAGDVVVAQIYGRTGAVTVLRRFEPPVLVAASVDPAEARVHIVDGVNVVIRGKVISSWRI